MVAVRTGLLALALAFGTFAMMVPAANAADVGCHNMGATGVVTAPPGAGFGLGWAPDCIIVQNGSPVRFAQVDAIGHTVVAGSCVVGPSLLTNPGWTLTVKAEDGFLYANNKECDPAELQHRTGSGINRPTGERLPIVEITDTTATLYFICGVHGPVMHGKIIVNL